MFLALMLDSCYLMFLISILEVRKPAELVQLMYHPKSASVGGLKKIAEASWLLKKNNGIHGNWEHGGTESVLSLLVFSGRACSRLWCFEVNLKTGKCSFNNLQMFADKMIDNAIVELQTDDTTVSSWGLFKRPSPLSAVHSNRHRHSTVLPEPGGWKLRTSRCEMDWDYLAGFALFCLFLASAVFQYKCPNHLNHPPVMGSILVGNATSQIVMRVLLLVLVFLVVLLVLVYTFYCQLCVGRPYDSTTFTCSWCPL